MESKILGQKMVSKTVIFISLFFLPFLLNAQSNSVVENKSFTFEDLKDLIEGKEIDSIDNLLPLLPETMRSNYSLMYESKSIQPASFASPRVIMFGKEAKLVLAYNGDPNLSKFSGAKNPFYGLEAIQWRDDSKRFDFYRINFPPPGSQDRNVLFSERNPASCLGCHQSDPRPNWEHYPIWPGAYGSESDNMSFADEDPDRKELKEFKKFLESSHESPRYKHLSNLDTRFDVSNNNIPSRPNTILGAHLTQLNNQRIVRLMQQLPEYTYLKFAIAAIFSLERKSFDNDTDPKDIPGPVSSQMILDSSLGRANLLAELPPRELYSNEELRGKSFSEQRKILEKSYSSFDILEALFKKAGYSMTNLSMDFHSVQKNLSVDGIGNTDELLAEMVKADSELQVYFKIVPVGGKYQYAVDAIGFAPDVAELKPEFKRGELFESPIFDILVARAVDRKREIAESCRKKSDVEKILENSAK
jgi:hypothetical protein